MSYELSSINHVITDIAFALSNGYMEILLLLSKFVLLSVCRNKSTEIYSCDISKSFKISPRNVVPIIKSSMALRIPVE